MLYCLSCDGLVEIRRGVVASALDVNLTAIDLFDVVGRVGVLVVDHVIADEVRVCHGWIAEAADQGASE